MRYGSGSPIVHPTVTIGTEVLTVKIGLRAENIISRAGLSLDQAITPLKAGSKDPRNLDYLFQLFAAATADHYYQQGMMALTADDWISKLEALSGGDPELNGPVIAAMRVALVEAVVKRWPSLRAVPATTANALKDAEPETGTPQ